MNSYVTTIVVILFFVSCGDSDKKKGDAALPIDHPETTNIKSAEAQVEVEESSCEVWKTPQQYVTSVTNDLFSRSPNPAELALASTTEFDELTFIDNAIASAEVNDALTRFISNLFRVGNIGPEDPEEPDSVALATELRQELVTLVTRERDMPWPDFFTTRNIYCTVRTAKLYGYPVFDVEGFVSCQLPVERAGVLSLVSTLRAVPSSFISSNNNYKRVAFAVYLATGIELAAATNGPSGEGRGISLNECVPVTDQRVAESGLIFGTAAIPRQGSVCASCHSPHLAPLSVAFRRYGEVGELLTLDSVDRLGNNDTNGVGKDHLKRILKEQYSCWSPKLNEPAQTFEGLPGLGRVIAESSSLGRALGVQIPQHLSNIKNPGQEVIDSIEESYLANGKTLLAAFKGYLASETYRCAIKK